MQGHIKGVVFMITKQVFDYSEIFKDYMRLKDDKKPKIDFIFLPTKNEKRMKSYDGKWKCYA